MTGDAQTTLTELRTGRIYRFADWPNPAVPNGSIGLYTVWHGDQLIYVGMSGRAVNTAAEGSYEGAPQGLRGLRSRLDSHASGRRSGDQFCVYVFDRLVLPTLSREQIDDAARGRLSLDELTRKLIRHSLSYRFALVADAPTARAVERQIQRQGLAGQLPVLNPARVIAGG
jgi:hypothetical protein